MLHHKLVAAIGVILAILVMPSCNRRNSLRPVVKHNIEEINRLDSLLSMQGELAAKKEARINTIRMTMSHAESPEVQLPLASRLLDEYKFYDSDSALHYANLINTLAQEVVPVNDSLVVSSLLDRAYMLSIQGQNDEAARIIDNIKVKSLDGENLMKYYRTREHANAMRLTYGVVDKIKSERMSLDMVGCRDSIYTICKKNGYFPQELIWIPVATQLDKNTAHIDPRDLNNLHLAVDTATDLASIDQANAYWLSQYYKKISNEDLELHYLLKGAQSSVASQRREMTSLPKLAQYLYEYGDINHANYYITYSYNLLNAYKDRTRMLNLSQALTNVRDSYQSQLEARDRRLNLYLRVLFILVIVLFAGVFLFIVRNTELRRTRHKLLKSNEDLNNALGERDKAIATLEQAIKELRESDDVSRGVIAFTFSLTAHFINEMDNFRKKLLRKFRARQYDEVGVLLSDCDMVRDQYAVFYAGFDKTILSIFPDFIDDYNEASPDDVKVDKTSIEKSGALNMRLRIYALRRLGVEKSADIAQMLNVSIRTVYNNRSTDPKPHVTA